AGADEQHVPRLIGPENLLNFGDQLLHAIADARVAELPEIRQVLAHLCVGQAEAFAKLLGGDRASLFASEAFKLAEVKAESPYGGVGDQLGSKGRGLIRHEKTPAAARSGA